MDEGQHVGDHLDHRCRPQGPHVENPVADGLQRRQVQVIQRPVAPGENGDLAACRQVDAPGHGGLHELHAMLCRKSTQAKNVVPAKRGVFHPACAGFHARQHLAEHRLGDGGRRQAGDDMIHPCRQMPGTRSPGGPHRQVPVGQRPVPVMDRHRESRLQQTCRQMPAQIAQAHIAVADHASQPTMPLTSQKSWMPQSAYSRPLPDCL